MIVKDFLPPVLVRLGRVFLGLEGSREYKDYTEAMKACTIDAYQNTDLCNMIADKTLIHIESLKEKPYGLNPSNVFLLAAINQYLNVYSKKNLKILDFGGACGSHYFEIRRCLPADVSIKWYVVETDQMVKSAIERKFNSKELNFVSSIVDINTEIDFIHSSSALQYVPAPYDFLNLLITTKPKMIFFNRMIFNTNVRDFVTVQKSFLSSNGPGKLPFGYKDRIISYPHTTMSFNKFNSTIISKGYELEWVFETSSGSYKANKEIIIGKGLLYIQQ